MFFYFFLVCQSKTVFSNNELVRQNFQGIPISPQGQLNEPATRALRTEDNTNCRFTTSMWCYWIPVIIQFPGALSGNTLLTLVGLSSYHMFSNTRFYALQRQINGPINNIWLYLTTGVKPAVCTLLLFSQPKTRGQGLYQVGLTEWDLQEGIMLGGQNRV